LELIKIDHYKHIINTILVRGEMIKLWLADKNKTEADRIHNSIKSGELTEKKCNKKKLKKLKNYFLFY